MPTQVIHHRSVDTKTMKSSLIKTHHILQTTGASSVATSGCHTTRLLLLLSLQCRLRCRTFTSNAIMIDGMTMFQTAIVTALATLYWYQLHKTQIQLTITTSDYYITSRFLQPTT
jgi:hypothetical protein